MWLAALWTACLATSLHGAAGPRPLALQLGLDDLCLSAEAPHLRHPGSADAFGPYADLPGGLERSAAGGALPGMSGDSLWRRAHVGGEGPP